MKKIISFTAHFCREFLKVFKEEKKWYLAPIFFVLLMTAALIVVLNISSPVLPFIYPLF